jgi:hypothetical protein
MLPRDESDAKQGLHSIDDGRRMTVKMAGWKPVLMAGTWVFVILWRHLSWGGHEPGEKLAATF